MKFLMVQSVEIFTLRDILVFLDANLKFCSIINNFCVHDTNSNFWKRIPTISEIRILFPSTRKSLTWVVLANRKQVTQQISNMFIMELNSCDAEELVLDMR